MKKILLFVMFVCISVFSYAQYVADDLPKTFKYPMPGGFMECTIHKDGTVTSVMCTGCYLCNGVGMCQVCMGNGRRYIPAWNSFMQCGRCLGSGRCAGCNGKGYSVINTTTEYGATIGIDERGNMYVGGSSGSSSGSSRSYVDKIEEIPCYGYDCDVYCKKCDKVRPRHVHVRVSR